MFRHLSAKTLVTFWFLLVASGVALVRTLGIEFGFASSVVLTGAALTPPVMVWRVWRDSAPSTVAELIHDVESDS